jgi:hypothetical protein
MVVYRVGLVGGRRAMGSLANDRNGHVGSIGFIASIRFVRFLVDLLKCEAIYQSLISGNLHALKKMMG